MLYLKSFTLPTERHEDGFLLSMTDTPIGAIAAMCGFRSEIALHKFFKLSTGMCMREWRKRNSKR